MSSLLKGVLLLKERPHPPFPFEKQYFNKNVSDPDIEVNIRDFWEQ